MIFRLRRMIHGTKVSVARTMGYSAWYIILAVLVLSGSFFLPIPIELFVAYPIIFAITFLIAFEIARRRIVYWKSSDGAIYQKGGVPIYLFYLIGLIARIAIGYIYIGPNFFFPIPTPGETISGAALSATIVTDLILIAGVGLLFGRNMRILKKYLAVKSGKETIEVSPSEKEGNSSMPA